MGRATPSPPRAVTAYPAAMFLAAFTSALQAKPQAVHTKRAWLSRDSGSTCPHTEHRWLVNAGLIFSTRPGALSSSRRTSSPQPDRRISRLSPDLARTFLPGLPAVPLAERVMFLIWRSSTLIRSNRRATAVLVFSTQSLRRSFPRAFSLATASLTCLRRLEPCLARASLRSSRRSLFRSRLSRLGACSNSPVDRAADTAIPRSMPTTAVVPGAGITLGIAANAICQRPTRSRVTR